MSGFLVFRSSVFHLLLNARQYNAAIQQLQRTLELDSNFASVWFVLGIAYLETKKFEDSTRAWVRWAELEGENKELMQHFVSLVEKHEQTGESVSLPPELEDIFGRPRPEDLWGHLPPYAMLGHKEKTLELLEQAYNEGDYVSLYELKVAPHYDFIRSEPRYIALMRKMEFEE